MDESPDCCEHLRDVLASQGETIRALHTLTRVGVAMAGANEFVPYQESPIDPIKQTGAWTNPGSRL